MSTSLLEFRDVSPAALALLLDRAKSQRATVVFWRDGRLVSAPRSWPAEAWPAGDAPITGGEISSAFADLVFEYVGSVLSVSVERVSMWVSEADVAELVSKFARESIAAAAASS